MGVEARCGWKADMLRAKSAADGMGAMPPPPGKNSLGSPPYRKKARVAHSATCTDGQRFVNSINFKSVKLIKIAKT